ncbi:MAG: tRNA pseudouridine(55) synthase TruB, partial [Frankiaceae bacterium]|nr:tRNA pseudouridine(55) synthase TruB [Frankiaceae bacterium]
MSDGLVVVDKPAGWTSHDVVARIRKLAGTRKVGHAGTLDPMATGVLVVGVNKATRLLGYIAGKDKAYDAVIRLGVATSTDDADGEVLEERDAAGISDEQITAAIAQLTGDIEQVPSSVSAIKVDGVRAYKRVRDGEAIDLPARPVTVSTFALVARTGPELAVSVECSTGTYVRALARDLGAALGVGAHLTALRRTRVGGFGIDRARTLDALAADLAMVPIATAAEASFPQLRVSDDVATRITHGQRVPMDITSSPAAVFGPDGSLVALIEDRDG